MSALTVRAAWSQRKAESEPVTARLGPTSSPSRSARVWGGDCAERSTAAGRLLTSREPMAASRRESQREHRQRGVAEHEHERGGGDDRGGAEAEPERRRGARVPG